MILRKGLYFIFFSNGGGWRGGAEKGAPSLWPMLEFVVPRRPTRLCRPSPRTEWDGPDYIILIISSIVTFVLVAVRVEGVCLSVTASFVIIARATSSISVPPSTSSSPLAFVTEILLRYQHMSFYCNMSSFLSPCFGRLSRRLVTVIAAHLSLLIAVMSVRAMKSHRSDHRIL